MDGMVGTSALSMITEPSNGTCDGRQGCEPVAMRKMSPVMLRAACPWRVTSMACGLVKRAVPCTEVIWCRAMFSSMSCQAFSLTWRSRCMKSATDSSDCTWNSTPYMPLRRSPDSRTADSRSVLDGMVPVLTAAPPGLGARSIRQTFFPKYAACAAPFSPAGPAPTTTRSKCSFIP